MIVVQGSLEPYWLTGFIEKQDQKINYTKEGFGTKLPYFGIQSENTFLDIFQLKIIPRQWFRAYWNRIGQSVLLKNKIKKKKKIKGGFSG